MMKTFFSNFKEYSLKRLLLYFLKLGTVGFGGPVALVGYMEQDLVEKRSWISKEEFLHGLAFAQMAPGPLAAQLAVYLGYIRGNVLGATLSGLTFILPSFFMVVVLGMLYLDYGGLPWVRALFYGISAAVIAIMVKSIQKLAKITLKESLLLWLIFAVMCVVTAYTQREIVWLFILCGFIAFFLLAPPRFTGTNILLPIFGLPIFQWLSLANPEISIKLFLYFAKAGVFVFGSGLAIVPFLHGGVVQQYHWLNERQFLDAIAVAMITPGPIVITAGFIGYLVHGLSGAVAAAAGVFLPVYVMVVIFTPYFERYGKNLQVIAFVQGVTSAATGAIAGAVIVLGRRAVVDIPTGAITLVALLALFRFKISEPLIVMVAGLLGLFLYRFR